MYRDAWIKIDLDAYQHNIEALIEKTSKKLIAVIKANAYGCGAGTMYEYALKAGADMFAVSSLEEALSLRNDGCKNEILILGYVGFENLDLVLKNELTLTTISLDWIKKLITYKPQKLKVQIKLDTGMNRVGIKTKSDLDQALHLLLSNDIKVEGIFTHYACSDEKNNPLTMKQFNKFKNMVENCNYNFKWIHASNSDASILLDENFTNAIRVGISTLGINTYDKSLKNVVSLYCKVVNIKEIEENETISYGATYTSSEKEIIATLPIGYADGWLRCNQNRKVFINNEYAPIVGRICMDQMMIKLKNKVPVGTVVELFGKNISVSDIAKETNTIPYEIITILSDRLTRVYYKDNKYLNNINPRLNRSENNKPHV